MVTLVIETFAMTVITALSVLYTVVAVATSHVILSTPIPLEGTTHQPLHPNGANYPCQVSGEGATNQYNQGSTYPLRFIGQAVHGGGSCQISLSYDTEPTMDSIFKVIRSIEGGCPAQDQKGNMGDDPDAENPFKYDFTIPPNIPAGNVTIAWTWFNKVGNREMYMNCARAVLNGKGGPRDEFDALPDMFRAHISNGCEIPEGYDVMFPNPGNDVTSMNMRTDAFAKPTGPSCDAAISTELMATSQDYHSSVTSSSVPAIGNDSVSSYISATPETEHILSEPSHIQASNISGTGYADNLETSPVARSESSVLYHDDQSIEEGSRCTEEGRWHCIGNLSFQRCASGRWSAVQGLADGASCPSG